jgi:hypothetical protein
MTGLLTCGLVVPSVISLCVISRRSKTGLLRSSPSGLNALAASTWHWRSAQPLFLNSWPGGLGPSLILVLNLTGSLFSMQRSWRAAAPYSPEIRCRTYLLALLVFDTVSCATASADLHSANNSCEFDWAKPTKYVSPFIA